MNDHMLASLYCFAAIFLGLGGLCVLLKSFVSQCSRTSCEERDIDSRMMEQWLEAELRRESAFAPPTLPRTDAEYFLAAPDVQRGGVPVPLPPVPTGERETW